jgi:hypothetical protein
MRRRRISWCLRIAVAVGLWLIATPTTAQPKVNERQLLKRFAHEPTVQQIQEAAVRYYQVHPERIYSLRRNARLKALMPTITGRFTNSLTKTKRNMDDGLFINALQFKEKEQVNGDTLGYYVEASWNLDRLVFNAEVLDVQSLIGILDGLVREVTTVYYIRRRLQIDMILRPPRDIATKISQRLRIEELTGLLDAMTGNYMTKSIGKKGAAG